MKLIWEKWKSLAEKIGAFQANIILSIIYFILVVPIGVVSGLFNDFLNFKSFPTWNDFESESSSIKEMKEQ